MPVPQQFTLVRQPARHGAVLRASAVELTFHATERVQETSAGSLTQYPVEASADEPRGEVASNYTNHPRTLTLNVVHSDTPIDADATTRAGLADEMREQLDALKQAATVLTVLSGTRAYPNMVILDWQEGRENRNGQTFRPTIRLQQVRFASSQVVSIPLIGELDDARTSDDVSSTNGARDGATTEADAGRQTASEADQEVADSVPPAVRLLRAVGVQL